MPAFGGVFFIAVLAGLFYLKEFFYLKNSFTYFLPFRSSCLPIINPTPYQHCWHTGCNIPETDTCPKHHEKGGGQRTRISLNLPISERAESIMPF